MLTRKCLALLTSAFLFLPIACSQSDKTGPTAREGSSAPYADTKPTTQKPYKIDLKVTDEPGGSPDKKSGK